MKNLRENGQRAVAEGEGRNSQAKESDSDETLEKGMSLPTKQPIWGIFQVQRQRQVDTWLCIYLPFMYNERFYATKEIFI